MAEATTNVKGTIRKNKKDLPTSRSFLHCAGTPLGTVGCGRLSLMSNAKLQKITSTSLDRLSFISEKDDNSDIENYRLEYSIYLLRKIQNRILTKNKQENEENVKKCFVSLKCELEDLLKKYIKLSKDIGYFKIFFEIQRQSQKMVEDGKTVLKLLKEDEFDSLMSSLSNSLDHTVNQLQLVDFDKNLIDDMFSKKIWGSGSEIDECLKKIESYVNKNNNEVSHIAGEIVEIKALCSENMVLRERFQSVFQQTANEILQTNYKVFTDVAKRAFDHREQYKNEFTSLSFDCNTDFLQSGIKLTNTPLSLQLSKLEGSYPVMPNSSSTPQPN